MQTDCSNAEKNRLVVDVITRAGLVEVHRQECRNTFFVHRAFLPRMRAKAGGGSGG